MNATRATALLYRGVVIPLSLLARPYWRSRLGLRFDRAATTYWHDRERRRITARDLKSQR